MRQKDFWGLLPGGIVFLLLTAPFAIMLSHIAKLAPPEAEGWLEALSNSALHAGGTAALSLALALAGARGLLFYKNRKIYPIIEALAFLPAFIPPLLLCLSLISLVELFIPFPFGLAALIGAQTLAWQGPLAAALARRLAVEAPALSDWALIHGAKPWRFLFALARGPLKRDMQILSAVVFTSSFTSLSAPMLMAGSAQLSLEFFIYEKLQNPVLWPEAMSLILIQTALMAPFYLLAFSFKEKEAPRARQRPAAPPPPATSLAAAPPPPATSLAAATPPPAASLAAATPPRGRASGEQSAAEAQLREEEPGGTVRLLPASALLAVPLAAPAMFLLSGGLSFHWPDMKRLFQLKEILWPAFASTMALSAGAGLLTLLGLILMAISLQNAMARKLTLSFLNPQAAVTGFAALLLPFALYGGWAAASFLLFFPAVYRFLGERLLKKAEPLSDAARLMGAGPWLIFKDVLWPCALRRGFFLCAGLAAALAAGEFACSFIISRGRWNLALVVYDLFSSYRISMALHASWLLALSCALMFMLFVFAGQLMENRKRRRGRASAMFHGRGARHKQRIGR